MTSSTVVHFKVYCAIGDSTEVKRFFVDNDAVTSFVFMKEKLKAVFPHLRDAEFKILWKDSDGDFISISNDDDFITALTEMSDNPKVLYINTESKNASEETPRVFRVVCDVCQKGITGYRYKCIECPDYDLCVTCEGNGHHSEHMVLRLPNSNAPFAKLDRKMMHNAARALKKSAFHVAKEAHRCARESMKFVEKDKTHNNRNEGTSASTPCPNANAAGCPFSGDMGEMFAQNINPLFEMFSRNMQNQGEAAPTPLTDLVRSVAGAFSNILNPEQTESAANTTENQQQPPPPQQQQQQQQQQHQQQQTTPTLNDSQTTLIQENPPSAPTKIAAVANNNPEMEWTILSDNDECTSQASATSLPPPPPQDLRLMRGLAQLHEMGFSNENLFLNYMLETHDFNVADVVKAILVLQ